MTRSNDVRPLVAHVMYRFDVGGLENGVVNFYAHYVLADIDPDTGVETDFFGLPLMLCAGAAVLGCKNRKKEEDE